MQFIYSRVSSDKQQTENQLHQLKTLYPNATVVEETISGATTTKPILNALLARLKSGDTLVVAALDRLGRSSGEAIMLMNSLYKRKIKVVSVREGLDYGTSAGKFQGQIMLAMSELERSLISERTKAALQAKKAQGVKLGPPRKYDDNTIQKLKDYRAQGLNFKQIEKLVGISAGHICRLVKSA